MVKKILILFIAHCSLLFANCLSQSITWQRTYGNSHINEGFSIVQTPDNGYIAVGRDRINMFEKTWILRLNQYGDTLWTKFVMNDMPVKIIKTNDNNYVILGTYEYVLKMDINGNFIWNKGPYASTKFLRSIKQTFDGGYIICGWKFAGNIDYPYLFKISSNGDSLWEQTYTNGIFDGRFYDLTITNDNNIVMTGNLSDSAYITDKLFLMKTDNSGNQLWIRRYDSLRSYQSRTIINTPIGSFITAGIYSYNNKPYYAKFDSSGLLNWLKIYNQSNPNVGYLRSVALTNDNGYAFTGSWDTIGNLTEYVLLLKTDTSGNEIWHRSFGFNNADRGNEVKQTSDSGFIINGLRGNYQLGDIFLIKTDKNGNSTPIGINPINYSIPVKFYFYPIISNPSNPEVTLSFDIPFKSMINLTIFDVLGREVETVVNEILSQGFYKFSLKMSNLSSGVYFFRLISLDNGVGKSFLQSQKFLLIK